MITLVRNTPRLTSLLKPLVIVLINAFRERPVTPDVGTSELSRAPTEADMLRWPTDMDRCRRSIPLKCLESAPVALLIIRLSKTPFIAPRTIPDLPLLQLCANRSKLRKFRSIFIPPSSVAVTRPLSLWKQTAGSLLTTMVYPSRPPPPTSPMTWEPHNLSVVEQTPRSLGPPFM